RRRRSRSPQTERRKLPLFQNLRPSVDRGAAGAILSRPCPTERADPMSLAELKPVIERAFENCAEINAQTKGEVRDAVNEAVAALDSGEARVAEKTPKDLGGTWEVNQWLKMAVLLSFRLNDMSV